MVVYRKIFRIKEESFFRLKNKIDIVTKSQYYIGPFDNYRYDDKMNNPYVGYYISDHQIKFERKRYLYQRSFFDFIVQHSKDTIYLKGELKVVPFLVQFFVIFILISLMILTDVLIWKFSSMENFFIGVIAITFFGIVTPFSLLIFEIITIKKIIKKSNKYRLEENVK